MRKTVQSKITDLQPVSESEVRVIIHPDVAVKYTFEDHNGKRITERKAERLQAQGESVKMNPKSTNSLWLGLPSLRLQIITDNPAVIKQLERGKKVKLTIEV